MNGLAVRLTIAKNIRIKRKNRGMSLKQLAGKVMLSYQQVQKYEAGENSIKSEKLVEIARIFDCRVDELCE